MERVKEDHPRLQRAINKLRAAFNECVALRQSGSATVIVFFNKDGAPGAIHCDRKETDQ